MSNGVENDIYTKNSIIGKDNNLSYQVELIDILNQKPLLYKDTLMNEFHKLENMINKIENNTTIQKVKIDLNFWTEWKLAELKKNVSSAKEQLNNYKNISDTIARETLWHIFSFNQNAEEIKNEAIRKINLSQERVEVADQIINILWKYWNFICKEWDDIGYEENDFRKWYTFSLTFNWNRDNKLNITIDTFRDDQDWSLEKNKIKVDISKYYGNRYLVEEIKELIKDSIEMINCNLNCNIKYSIIE